MKIEFTKTQRGFRVCTFKDLYDKECSIQKSSLATDDAIWIGIDDPTPQVLASRASEYGVKTEETTGWVPYPIPEGVSLATRMHLNREQVAELLPILKHFIETGDLE